MEINQELFRFGLLLLWLVNQKVKTQNEEPAHCRQHSRVIRKGVHDVSLVFVVPPWSDGHLVGISDETVARAAVVNDPLVNSNLIRELLS